MSRWCCLMYLMLVISAGLISFTNSAPLPADEVEAKGATAGAAASVPSADAGQALFRTHKKKHGFGALYGAGLYGGGLGYPALGYGFGLPSYPLGGFGYGFGSYPLYGGFGYPSLGYGGFGGFGYPGYGGFGF